MIRLLRPQLPPTDALVPYLRKIDAQRWYSNFGPLSKEFEVRFERMFLPSTLTLSTAANCGIALELAIQSLGITKGTALLPAVTFPGTGVAALRAGMEVALADVDPRTWQLTSEYFKKYIKDNPVPDLVMPVAAFGRSIDTAEWLEIVNRYGCTVLIDAAGAVGSQVFDSNLNYAVSFHATKVLPMGEGGGFITNNSEAIERFKRLINFGIDTRVNRGYVDLPGTNAKLSEYHAAVGLASLDEWQETSLWRKTLIAKYIDKLTQHAPNVALQDGIERCICSVLPVLLPSTANSSTVGNYLAHAEIETRRWYLPTLNEHPLFGSSATSDDLTNSKALSRRLLGLPFHRDLTETNIDYIVKSLVAAIHSTAT